MKYSLISILLCSIFFQVISQPSLNNRIIHIKTQSKEKLRKLNLEDESTDNEPPTEIPVEGNTTSFFD